MRDVTAAMVGVAVLVGGCAARTPTLPDDPVDKAASCAAIAAASERAAAGVKGDLSADAQGRILHYALLAGSEGSSFDADRANAVTKREQALFDQTIRGKWETLKPACAAAYPATAIATPTLPQKPLDAVLQCDAVVGFMRKTLGGDNVGFTEAVSRYGVLEEKLSNKAAPLIAANGLKGDALKTRRDAALALAAKLGQPPAVIAACEKKYGG